MGITKEFLMLKTKSWIHVSELDRLFCGRFKVNASCQQHPKLHWMEVI